MKPVFADTFYWISLTSPAEAAYERANQVTDEIVTIDEVLTEYLTSSARPLNMCAGRPPKNVQQIEGLTDILTNDKHFEQEGFRALFRDS